jgi:DNA replication protein DnaC
MISTTCECGSHDKKKIAMDILMSKMPDAETMRRIEKNEDERVIFLSCLKKEKDTSASEAYMSGQLAKIPRRFKEASFDNYELEPDSDGKDNSKIRAKQRFLIENLRAGKSVVAYGTNGTGKTHLAFAAMKEQILKGRSCKYVIAIDIYDQIRKSFDDKGARAVLAYYARQDYLVIDEVDKSYGSPTEFINLYRVINRRYEDCKPTVVIANGSRDQIIEIIGRSSYERLVEGGAAIEMNWDSYRKKKVLR